MSGLSPLYAPQQTFQSTSFPFTEPNKEEIAERNAIVGSLKYCRDFPSELPPLTVSRREIRTEPKRVKFADGVSA